MNSDTDQQKNTTDRVVPKPRRQIWQKLGVTPRGFDREVVELMHRTHMGVDQEFANIIRQASQSLCPG